MTDSKNKNKIIKQLSDDLATTLQCLSTNVPYKSSTWRLFRSKEQPGKRYNIDNLAELLLDVQQGKMQIGVMRYTKGDLEHARGNPDVAKHLKTVTAINLRDLIYACCYDKTFLNVWFDEIAAIIHAPHPCLDADTSAALSRILYRINNAINTQDIHSKKAH